MNIEFVSYSGEWPNLCSGILKAKVNGKDLSFGYEVDNGAKSDYPKFWTSGGSVSFDEEWNESVLKGPWELEADEEDYPPEIWKILPRLVDLMNEHVSHGCCGGCV